MQSQDQPSLLDEALSNLKSEDSKVRADAVEKFVAELCNYARSGKYIKTALDRTLTEAGTLAVGPLVRCLDDENRAVRMFAAQALGRIRDPQAAEPLLKLLDDSGAEVRRYGAEALTEIAERGAAALLSERAIGALTSALGTGSKPSDRAVLLILARNAPLETRARITLAHAANTQVAVQSARRLRHFSAPQDDTLQPGESLSVVASATDLELGNAIRMWHDMLDKWAIGWSEVRLVAADSVCLRTRADEYHVYPIYQILDGTSWKHPCPERLFPHREGTADSPSVELTWSQIHNSSGPPNADQMRANRSGRCATCGSFVKLVDARRLSWDWDGVDAYPYYCRKCYVEGDTHTGRLLGADGRDIVDQVVRSG